MILQGRILRVAFSDKLVCELGKIITPPSSFGLQTGRDGPLPFAKLYDVLDMDGERILRDLGPPPGALYGCDVNAMFTYPQFWVSQADIDEGRVK
ncbi:hypothetical protein KIKIMORA_01850 [Brevundimonas phage vB_BpoS-Kikimora]|uniref:Uncharacterized protein n=2 Tax=Kikimoravirus TaxID=3425051 RepID=A0A9E7N1W4_9CAUD|nr:hypothetical protein KIKIMORA_01850 [Brevundimonas phage vB_BpoS-Kikimora]UTC28223.1 hypothetical protein GURKE_01920 [Brevundimonas phage vB_BpoS-Gurke]